MGATGLDETTTRGDNVEITSFASPQIPRLVGNLSLHQEGDMSDIVNSDAGRIFVVNQIGRRVMEMCDGKNTVTDIVVLDLWANARTQPLRG